jgi:hypothetical protein
MAVREDTQKYVAVRERNKNPNSDSPANSTPCKNQSIQ